MSRSLLRKTLRVVLLVEDVVEGRRRRRCGSDDRLYFAVVGILMQINTMGRVIGF